MYKQIIHLSHRVYEIQKCNYCSHILLLKCVFYVGFYELSMKRFGSSPKVSRQKKVLKSWFLYYIIRWYFARQKSPTQNFKMFPLQYLYLGYINKCLGVHLYVMIQHLMHQTFRLNARVKTAKNIIVYKIKTTNTAVFGVANKVWLVMPVVHWSI